MSTLVALSPTTHFFSLPAELRNIIYEYVLTTNEPVIPMPHRNERQMSQSLLVCRAMARFRYSSPSQLNQVKFVCKQMHNETDNLGPGFSPNLIFPFRRGTPRGVSVICSWFLENMTARLNAIRQIDLHERAPYRARAGHTKLFDLIGIGQLSVFARERPNTTINVYLECLGQRKFHGSIGLVIDVLNLVLRKGCDPLVCQVFFRRRGYENYHEEVASQMAQVWEGYAEYAPPFPDNMIFKPTRMFDEEAWANQYLDDFLPLYRHIGFILLREWYRSGF